MEFQPQQACCCLREWSFLECWTIQSPYWEHVTTAIFSGKPELLMVETGLVYPLEFHVLLP